MSSPPPGPAAPITDIVFDWAARTPDKTAIIHDGTPLSYRALARQIAVARGFFAGHGYAGPGVAVLAVHNLKEVWVLSLALRSLGLTTIAVPPAVRIEGLDLPDLRCVVTTPAEAWPDLADACASRRLPLVSAALAGAAPLALDATPPTAPGGHILLTSGTTGVTKMVLYDPSFEPEFIRRRRRISAEMLDMTQESVDHLIDFAAWTGGGYKGMVCGLASGATVVIDQRPERYKTLLLPGVTHSLIVPGMLDSVLAGPAGAEARRGDIHLSSIGGPLTQGQIEQIKTHITANLYNGYAATESGPIAVTRLDTPEDSRWHHLVCEVQLVDDFDRPVPTGQVGRVRVSAEGGPTGYLNDEAATKAFFKDGYFYTGDLAVMRADGRMALQGRVTDVINFEGHKISPAPIEDRLRDSFAASGVCLFSMQDDAGEEEIHVVIETRAPVETGRLTEVLRRELMGFARAQVHYTTALPRNAMGKVLRVEARRQALGQNR